MVGLDETIFNKALSLLNVKPNPAAQKILHAGTTTVSDAYYYYLQANGDLARFDVPEKLEKAIQLFQQAIRKDSRYALAYAGLGEAYFQKFKNSKERKWAAAAMYNCRQAQSIDNHLARVHIILGMVYAGLSRPEQAVKELNGALAIEPRNADAYRELGRAYEKLGKTDQAEATFRKAILLQPDSWTATGTLRAFFTGVHATKNQRSSFWKLSVCIRIIFVRIPAWAAFTSSRENSIRLKKCSGSPWRSDHLHQPIPTWPHRAFSKGERPRQSRSWKRQFAWRKRLRNMGKFGRRVLSDCGLVRKGTRRI